MTYDLSESGVSSLRSLVKPEQIGDLFMKVKTKWALSTRLSPCSCNSKPEKLCREMICSLYFKIISTCFSSRNLKLTSVRTLCPS